MRHILFADDEPAIRRLVFDVLTDEGFEVSLAADRSEALAALAGPVPHLVILDLLPGLDPVAFCSYLEARHGPVPVLIVSGAVSIRSVAEGLGAHFLSKPFDLAEFITLVGKLVNGGEPGGQEDALDEP